jgi:hypothetical protein
MATVTLINSDWHNGVNINVRIGNDTVPQNNPELWTGNVAYQASRQFDAQDTTIWHQRDLNPDHPTRPPTYGDWMATEVFEADVEDTI